MAVLKVWKWQEEVRTDNCTKDHFQVNREEAELLSE
jgi:hypothetical protein